MRRYLPLGLFGGEVAHCSFDKQVKLQQNGNVFKWQSTNLVTSTKKWQFYTVRLFIVFAVLYIIHLMVNYQI